jgi:hypothetical protein
LLLHAPSNIFSHNFEPLSSVMGFWVHERRRHWSGTKIDWLHSTCLAWYLKKYQWSVEVFSFTHRSSIQFVWFTRTNLVKLSRPNSVSNCFHQVPQLHIQLFQIFNCSIIWDRIQGNLLDIWNHYFSLNYWFLIAHLDLPCYKFSKILFIGTIILQFVLIIDFIF